MTLFASWPWEWSASAWSALTFLVLLAAAVAGARQVREARGLREEQVRPFVLIDFRAWQTIVEIVITNIGSTLAREVTFSFDPPLASTRDNEPTARKIGEVNILKTGIPSLAPQKEIKLFFDSFPARLEQGLPMTYEVTISYSDSTGKRHYADPSVLDLSMYLGTGGIHHDGVHEINKQLKQISDNLKRWTDTDGLKIMSRADIRQRSAEREAHYEERQAAAALKSPGDKAPGRPRL